MRALVLDGIRGWAALFVVLFHFYKELLKGVYPEVESTWWLFFIHGEFYVFIFFVLSGEALSTAFFRTMDPGKLDALLIKRYFRLTVPILFSTLIVYFIIHLGFDYHQAAATTLKSEGWLSRFLTGDTSFPRLIKFSLIDVYTKHTTQMSFNPFLWTMSVEMVGSLLVFCVCYAWPRLRQPYVLTVAATLALMALGSYYSLFVAGMLIAAFKAQIQIDMPRKNRATVLASLLAPLICLVALQAMHDQTVPIALYCFMSILSVCCAQYNPIYSRFFSSRISLYLGKISFPIYLVHFGVMISITSHMHADAGFADFLPPFWASILVSSIGIAICLPVAHVFMLMEKAVVPRLEAAILRIAINTPSG